MALERFYLIAALKIQNAVELSVRYGVAGFS
jgi:hypothetical protein